MITYPISTKSTKRQLFDLGVLNATEFLKHNGLRVPTFYTYEEVFELPETSFVRRRLAKLAHGPKQGVGTGYYYDNTVFVSLAKAAKMQLQPRFQLWSYPGYKIDRTPYGVVAHEVGHHVDDVKGDPFRSSDWLKVLELSKRITSYEPKPWEAGAETMRLFITNPDLLYRGSPARFAFLLGIGLKPHIPFSYNLVLGDHPTYCEQASKWIMKRLSD